MDKQEIKNKILKDLDWGITPTYSRLGITKGQFSQFLKELEDDGYLHYTKIENHPVFKGEPKNIYITDKGREKARETK